MKALSIRQPWAWLIANGLKPVENRGWYTAFRGPFLIHASKTIDYDGVTWVRRAIAIELPSSFALGGIVGKAVLTGCVEELESIWFFGPQGFLIAEPKPLPLIECPGRLGFFDVSPAVAEAVRRYDEQAQDIQAPAP